MVARRWTYRPPPTAPAPALALALALAPYPNPRPPLPSPGSPCLIPSPSPLPSPSPSPKRPLYCCREPEPKPLACAGPVGAAGHVNKGAPGQERPAAIGHRGGWSVDVDTSTLTRVSCQKCGLVQGQGPAQAQRMRDLTRLRDRLPVPASWSVHHVRAEGVLPRLGQLCVPYHLRNTQKVVPNSRKIEVYRTVS